MAEGAQAQQRFVLGGHRGVGENLWGEGKSQPNATAPATVIVPDYRENTVQSFLAAARCGVDFVEFDVQVTSDGVPVIWHDDTLLLQQPGADGSVALEVKDMALQQFKSVVGGGGPSQLVRHFRGVKAADAAAAAPPRKLLPWVCAMEDTLPELRELFLAVPLTCGFDVEIKMTNGADVERTPPEEVARVVDAIWPVVELLDGSAKQQEGGPEQRHIFFSSFDPDVCSAIRLKQAAHQVWFLSGCGLYPHVDARRTSIPAALAFAEEQQLSGVVLPAKVLLANEGIVAQAAAKGLLLMSYGLENDAPAAVQRQRQLGVFGAIVDDVQSMMRKRD